MPARRCASVRQSVYTRGALQEWTGSAALAAVSVPKPVLQAASGWQQMAKKVQHWYDYLWLWPIIYFVLGFFNILFAWLGMIDFMVPVLLALFGGNKLFCNCFWQSWAASGSGRVTALRRSFWSPNGSASAFYASLWPCSAICCGRLIL